LDASRASEYDRRWARPDEDRLAMSDRHDTDPAWGEQDEPPDRPLPVPWSAAGGPPGPDTAPTLVPPPGAGGSWMPPLDAVEASPAKRRGVSRRGLLIGAGAGALGLGALGAGAGLLLSRHQGPAAGTPDLSRAGQIFHLLRRAGFGARPSEIDQYIALGVSGSIGRLLDPAAVADDVDAVLARMSLDLTKAADIQRWFLLRMIYSRRQLLEKMTLFWHGLLTSSLRKVGGARNFGYLVQQNELLRANAFGRFDDLIRAITIDPAMMWWLDLRLSTARAPNENYGRELMELFTLGIGNYTQDDVVAASRALTGWAILGGKETFVPRRHDAGGKTLLGQSGNLGLDDVVRIVCAHPATARHLAWRLWLYFVDESPSDADLQPLIEAYTRSDHNVGAVMRALLTVPAFFGPRAYRQRVKSPAEFVVGAVRALEVPTDGRQLPQALALMGQSLFDPPNVSGWDGDKVSANWMSTQAWLTRLNLVNALLAAATGATRAAGGASGGGASGGTPALQSLIDAARIASPQAFVDYFAASLLDDQLATDRHAAVSDYLSQATGGAGPALTLHGGARLPAAAARGALYLLMGMPEYHLN
jgi:hypothetical protein